MTVKSLLRWLPSLLIMTVIFIFSSIPSRVMPNFGWLDFIVKKGAHMLGYAMLAQAFWFAMLHGRNQAWLAFGLALIYAVLDEYHQSFIPGRNPSWVDALLIDGSGSALAVGLDWFRRFGRKSR